MPRWLSPLGLVAAFVASAAAQLPPDKALASLKPADGLQVELFAAEPMLINPTSMDVDPLGRIWVCEAVNYRRKMFNRPILRKEGDRIVILTDKDGDGKADESTVFYQGEDLYGPIGIAVAKDAKGSGYRVFVCQSPDILLFEDRDGDGKADGPPKKFLSGFGGFDHDHGVHGITIGPDGKFYFTVGDQGVKGLQSADGKGRKWTTNATDCQAGTVWRCDLDGTNLELIAHNFRNDYEACVDSFGEVWLSDNDDDGNQQTRICYVMPGGNYGYWPRGPGQTHWHEEQPGIVHQTLRTGFGSPTGICFYEGDLLPERFRGQLLHTDAGPRELRAFLRKPKGAGYELEKVNLLTSTDNWFRPSDVCVAPDGSVFVADWYDPGVGGHGMGDWTRGRVYRVTPKGHRGYRVPKVDLTSDAGLREALGSPNLAVQHMAHQVIRAMPDDKRFAWVSSLPGDAPKPLAARAAWLVSTTKQWEANEAKDHAGYLQMDEAMFAGLIRRVVEKGPYGAGPLVQMVRIMHERYGDLAKVPTPLRESYRRIGRLAPTPAVARELVLALKDSDPALAKAWFYDFANLYDGQDHFYRAALNIACGADPARRDAILADFDKHFPQWTDTVADLVWELRPKSVLPRLEELLGDDKLTPAQKGRIADILAVSDDPAAGRTLLKLLKPDTPEAIKARALENLRLFLPTKWKGIRPDEVRSVVGSLFNDARSVVTGLQLTAVAGDTILAGEVAKFANSSEEPAPVRVEAVRTLGKLRTPAAVAALVKHATGTGPLAAEAVAALGSQAAGPVRDEAAREALTALQGLVTGTGTPTDVKRSAVAALAGTRAGTGWLLQLQEKGQMPESLVADAGRLLRNSPFQGERNKALLLFPAPGKLDPKKLPPIGELTRRTGNAENGRKILMASLSGDAQCLKCHMVRGQGGQIGPDLSMIGKKGSRENLFESILQPSKAIADQYVSWRIDTTGGQSITGLLVQETDEAVVLRDANGKDYEIPVKDIDRRAKSLVSLMPDNLAAALTEDELVDLVEYLMRLQTPSLTPTVWSVAGPFPSPGGNEGLGKEYGPEKGPFDPKAKFSAGGTSSEVVWRPIRTGPGGYVDLRALHGSAATNSVSYLYAEVESPADQEATVLLGTDDGARLFVNGEAVHTGAATRAAAPEQDLVAVKLRKGSNAVLLKVANGDGPHGFYLTILSGQELKAK